MKVHKLILFILNFLALQNWCVNSSTDKFSQYRLKSCVINFGPQHPASHGVLRLVIQLRGEFIEKIDPHIGFLHRGSEKLMEYRNFTQASVYVDRLDYTSVLTQTHAYCLAVEKSATDVNNTLTTLAMRTIFDELARMLNHLLAISTHSLDVGSMATLFWAFEDRERIMEIFEFTSGARMHAALYLPCQDMSNLISNELILKILFFLKNCHKSFTEMYLILFNNRVWKIRLVSVGVLNSQAAVLFGATGPIARSSGVLYDNRVLSQNQYALYSLISFRSYLGISGDCYDRFLIRSRELFESMHIIYCACSKLLTKVNGFNNLNSSRNLILLNNYKTKMESLINKFKMTNDSVSVQQGMSYGAVEAGKGEFGVYLVTNNTNKPYRVFLRSPAYNHLQLISLLCEGHMFADLITLVGSLDLVFGEVDR